MAYKKGEKLKTAFDTYAVEEFHGAGSAGEVYTVHDTDNQALAAKILTKDKPSAAALKQFRAGMNFCITDPHPNVVPIHDCGTAKKGVAFYIMPLYAESLRDLIARGIERERVLPYFGQILDGVEAAHLHRAPHLDLKPENILYDPGEDRLMVADFGIAHLTRDDLLAAAESDGGELPTKFRYVAPEQKQREASVDHKADIFTLGLLLREMFVGNQESAEDGTPITVASIAPEFGHVDDMFAYLTSADPEQRPPTIDEVKKQLIARGNEYLSRQRLNALKSAVIPESEAGDSFLANPIKIISADYSEGIIYFKLNTNPTPNWIAAFKNPRAAFSFYTGGEPDTFVFNGDAMHVKLPGDANARQFVLYTKSYIDMANGQYREHVIAFHQRQMLAERESLRRQMAEEERRLRILIEIRNAL